jgi:hypothetical protein
VGFPQGAHRLQNTDASEELEIAAQAIDFQCFDPI